MLITILFTGVFFLILDFFWLNVLANGFYLKYMADYLHIVDGKIQYNFSGAILVYLVLLSGIFIFVLPRCTGFYQALAYGALYGLVTYGTYDFTNQAVIKNWPYILTVIDITWGMFICSITSAFAYTVHRWFL